MSLETALTFGIILIPFIYIQLTKPSKHSKKTSKPLYHKVWKDGQEQWLK